MIEISEEVSKMHGSLTTLGKSSTASKEDRTSRELDTHETKAVISKLQHVHTSIQQYKRYIQLQVIKSNKILIPLHIYNLLISFYCYLLKFMVNPRYLFVHLTSMYDFFLTEFCWRKREVQLVQRTTMILSR